MGRVVVSEFVTLDNVFEDPGGSEKKEYGGWQLELMGDDEGAFKFDELKNTDALLLGRITYEHFAQVWPAMEGTSPFAERMNNVPKYVATLSLTEFSWNNSRILGTDLAANVGQLKKDYDKDILVYGSGELVRALLEAGLVDELRLMTYPLVLGKGRRLFEGVARNKLKFVSSKEFESGTVMLTYTQMIQGR